MCGTTGYTCRCACRSNARTIGVAVLVPSVVGCDAWSLIYVDRRCCAIVSPSLSSAGADRRYESVLLRRDGRVGQHDGHRADRQHR